MSEKETKGEKKPKRLQRLIDLAMKNWEYCSEGVWNDSRNNWKVNAIKTANLSIRSFLNQDLQSQACAMTYRTLLAIVPALALLFAIGRGFGLQDVLQEELIKYFPSQRLVLNQAFGFVDSYLSQASGGIFVGIGIVFLLWTLISLLSSVEDSFNTIWQVASGRKIWRKITDYLAIFLVLPVLMICASGLSLFMTTSLKTLLPFAFLDSALSFLFDCLSIALTWVFFAGSYMLIPNTKVKPLPALISGVVVGSAYQILQWIFVSGQMYVSKYNAIYGSFSFLPLMLIWLQLVWLITLIGGVMCYSQQNISEFNYGSKIKNISHRYQIEITVVIMAIVARKFVNNEKPLTSFDIAAHYDIPINLVKPIVEKLNKAGLINYLNSGSNDLATHPLQPAINVTNVTVGDVISKVYSYGDSNFIPGFAKRYEKIIELNNIVTDDMAKAANTLLTDAIDIDANKSKSNNKIQS